MGEGTHLHMLDIRTFCTHGVATKLEQLQMLVRILITQPIELQQLVEEPTP